MINHDYPINNVWSIHVPNHQADQTLFGISGFGAPQFAIDSMAMTNWNRLIVGT